MKLTFTEAAWNDYLWFQDTDKKLLKRINLLIKDTLRNPFEGVGKPEPLKANLSGYWSGCDLNLISSGRNRITILIELVPEMSPTSGR
jgi:toxin YoeB